MLGEQFPCSLLQPWHSCFKSRAVAWRPPFRHLCGLEAEIEGQATAAAAVSVAQVRTFLWSVGLLGPGSAQLALLICCF